MANRNFNRRQALEKEVKDLYVRVSVGASGAPTLVSRIGIASIARDSAGTYTLVLQDRYVALKFFQVSFLDDSAQDLRAQILDDSSATADKYIQFATLTGASATDPQSGQTMLIKIELKNTTAV